MENISDKDSEGLVLKSYFWNLVPNMDSSLSYFWRWFYFFQIIATLFISKDFCKNNNGTLEF